jgi:nucleotide-binding universal stress UspA family protein
MTNNNKGDMNMIDYPKYKKVLFCTDFSKISDCAFEYAFGIAKRDEAILYILNVAPPPLQPHILDTYLSKEQLDKIEADHQEYLEKMFNDKYLNHIKDKTKVNIVTESGREDDKIIEFIQKEKIDILVIGTHGRTGMEHAFLGSVAEKVIRRSPIPVFVIPCRDKTGPT